MIAELNYREERVFVGKMHLLVNCGSTCMFRFQTDQECLFHSLFFGISLFVLFYLCFHKVLFPSSCSDASPCSRYRFQICSRREGGWALFSSKRASLIKKTIAQITEERNYTVNMGGFFPLRKSNRHWRMQIMGMLPYVCLEKGYFCLNKQSSLGLSIVNHNSKPKSQLLRLTSKQSKRKCK